MKLRTTLIASMLLIGLVLWAAWSRSAVQGAPAQLPEALNPWPPAHPVRLIFIHHSEGENWLADDNGGLGMVLRDNNYFVSDTNFGWGPSDPSSGGVIGDHNWIPDWYSWFTGPRRDIYLTALYAETEKHSSYSRLATNPGGPNTIILFNSSYQNSNLDGHPNDAPAASADNHSTLTVANAKRIYIDLLNYFATRQDKLFVAITAPPLLETDTTSARAANARAFNNWLVKDWLSTYPYQNVAVFDFYTVLTTNGGNADTNDLGAVGGNHHRYNYGVIQHLANSLFNYAAYPTVNGTDNHPSMAGNVKAMSEFVPLLNIYYNRWQASLQAPNLSTSTKQASAVNVQTGQRVTYTLALHNTGTLDASVSLTDIVPSGLLYAPHTFTASSGTASEALSPTLRWNGILAVGMQVTLRYAVTVTADSTQALVNTAAIVPVGATPFKRSATVIVNGYALQLPVLYKN
jgi:uncharacterized repeat protein (TIGR01451 family)